MRQLRRRTEHLLVAAEGEPHVLRRGEVPLEQDLDRLADAHQGALVVEGAAAPDSPVVDLGGEGRVLPRGRLVDRDHVEVRHQDDGPGRRRAGPAEEEAVGADPGLLQGGVQAGEQPLVLGEEGVERRGVDVGRVAVGDRRDAHQGLQLGHDVVGGRVDGHGLRLGGTPARRVR